MSTTRVLVSSVLGSALVAGVVLALTGCGHHAAKRPQAAKQTQAALAAHVAAQPDYVLPSFGGRVRWEFEVADQIPTDDRVPYDSWPQSHGLYGNAPTGRDWRTSREKALEALTTWCGLVELGQRGSPGSVLPPGEMPTAQEWHWFLQNPWAYLRSKVERPVTVEVVTAGGDWSEPGYCRLMASGLASDGKQLELGCPAAFGHLAHAAGWAPGPVLVGQAVHDESFALWSVRRGQ